MCFPLTFHVVRFRFFKKSYHLKDIVRNFETAGPTSTINELNLDFGPRNLYTKFHQNRFRRLVARAHTHRRDDEHFSFVSPKLQDFARSSNKTVTGSI